MEGLKSGSKVSLHDCKTKLFTSTLFCLFVEVVLEANFECLSSLTGTTILELNTFLVASDGINLSSQC